MAQKARIQHLAFDDVLGHAPAMAHYARIFIQVVCLLLVVAVGSRKAYSDNEVLCVGDYCELVTPDLTGHFDLEVSAETGAAITFPDRVTYIEGPHTTDFQLTAVADTLRIEVTEKAREGALLPFLTGSNRTNLNITVQLVPTRSGRHRSYRVTASSEIKKYKRAIIDDYETQRAGAEYGRKARTGLRGVYVRPVVSEVKNQGPVHVQIESGLWDDDELMVILKLQNNGTIPYRLKELAIRGRTRPIEPRHVYFDHDGMEASAANVMATLPPGADTSIVMFLPDKDDGELKSLYVEMNGLGAGTIVAGADDWERSGPVWLTPKSKEEIAEEKGVRDMQRKELERFRLNEEARGRRTVYLGGIFGSVSLDNAAGDNEFTTLMGVEVRAMYGFTRYLSVQGSVALSRTDEAQFDDGSTADATSGRILMGGVLRGGGGSMVPYAHAGIGARLSSHGRSGQDSELRSSGLYNVGGGINIQVSDDFAVGLSAQYVSGLGTASDNSAGFEAGIYAGYSWGPSQLSPQRTVVLSERLPEK